jgi:hypothetical protein
MLTHFDSCHPGVATGVSFLPPLPVMGPGEIKALQGP